MWLLWSGKNTRGLSSCKPTGKNKLLKKSKPKAEVQLVDLYRSWCRCRGRGRWFQGACSSRKFLKLNSLKCNFLHSLDWNWMSRKVFLCKKKLLTIKWNIWSGDYNYLFVVVCFSVDSKINSNQKECMNPWWQMVIHRYVQSSCCIESSEIQTRNDFHSVLKNTHFMCELLEITCQTTRHCTWHPAWNETPPSVVKRHWTRTHTKIPFHIIQLSVKYAVSVWLWAHLNSFKRT